MESQEVIETTMAFGGTNGVDDSNVCTSRDNEFESKQAGIGIEHNDNLEFEVLEDLEDLETMMEDIDNRLRIARMVSDSMIKGMVSAVEQEADEKIMAKELELTKLKHSLQFHNVNGDQNESCWIQETREPETVDVRGYVSFEDACVKHDRMKESSIILRNSAADQFKRLRKQIEGVRGCKIKRNGSCYEMVGLGGILKEEEYEHNVSLEKTIENLEIMMNNMAKLVDNVLTSSKTSLNEWQQEQELKGELKDMVLQSFIKSIQQEFNEQLLDQKASSCESQNIVLAEKFSNISNLRNEIEALTKLLPNTESGHLVSYGSLDVDHTHANPLRSQLSSRWDENGKLDESKPEVPDSFDANNISHMNKEELVRFFNNMILKMKREHEAEFHKLTESYISLKGKYLSERSFVSLPNKDFDTLKRKIPEVVSKLDGILSESDEFIGKGDSVASINVLNNSLSTLLRENRQLQDLLSVKKEEVKHLSSQLSAASESHKSLMADASLKASIVDDVYKCVFSELNRQIQDMKEESEVQIIAMQDIYEVLLGVASVDAKNSSVFEIGDTFMESLFMHELLETLFKATLTDLEQKFENLHKELITTNEKLVSLEKKAIEREVALILEAEESERLRNEVDSLRNVVDEKERLARELTKEREQFELALDECNNLRKQASWQETLMLKKNKEIDEMSEKLSKNIIEINSVNQKLKLATEEIKALNEYKNSVLALSEEKQSFMLLIEAKEKEHRKQMEAVVVLADELSTKFVDFESRVTRDIVNNNRRFENSRSELSSVIKAINALKRTGLQYKQKLERKCSDLQMAENEVDLLGDQVETLLDLLEKIYIALDHYSPVLKHYPGVIEILELVRRELSGESLKAH